MTEDGLIQDKCVEFQVSGIGIKGFLQHWTAGKEVFNEIAMITSQWCAHHCIRSDSYLHLTEATDTSNILDGVSRSYLLRSICPRIISVLLKYCERRRKCVNQWHFDFIFPYCHLQPNEMMQTYNSVAWGLRKCKYLVPHFTSKEVLDNCFKLCGSSVIRSSSCVVCQSAWHVGVRALCLKA